MDAGGHHCWFAWYHLEARLQQRRLQWAPRRQSDPARLGVQHAGRSPLAHVDSREEAFAAVHFLLVALFGIAATGRALIDQRVVAS